MNSRNKAWALGLAAWGAIAACSPIVHELGDDPGGGNGGNGGSDAGSGAVLPLAGSKPMGGQAGASQNVAGEGSEDCFSPTQNVELSHDPDATGCACDTVDQVCVGSEPGEPFWFGILSCASGRWQSVETSPGVTLADAVTACACGPDFEQACVSTEQDGRVERVSLFCEGGEWTTDPRVPPTKAACDVVEASCHVGGVVHPHGAHFSDDCNDCACDDGGVKCTKRSCPPACFSPTSRPELAVSDLEAGCACTDEPPECVETTYQGRPWRVALYCTDGKWTSAEDGVCGDGGQAECRVDGVTYTHGARRVPNPFSLCNTCDCNDGELVNCTSNRCAATRCEEGTYPSKRCVACGPADDCLEVESGCLSGPECDTGVCAEGRCG